MALEAVMATFQANALLFALQIARSSVVSTLWQIQSSMKTALAQQSFQPEKASIQEELQRDEFFLYGSKCLEPYKNDIPQRTKLKESILVLIRTHGFIKDEIKTKHIQYLIRLAQATEVNWQLKFSK